MLIKINGKEENLVNANTLADLVSRKNLPPETVVVEHNLNIIAAADLGKIFLKDQDTVEIIRFCGGG